ncbi:MAG: nucleotide sugar dehydrogenase [Pelistega sp.]|nr:nucleotide sugar dehydrogenase [Pelistega sp.]
MNVAIFGRTLYAGVMSALLAECGHKVFWCDVFDNDIKTLPSDGELFQETSLSQLLAKVQTNGFLQYSELSTLPLDIDAYLFSLNQTEEAVGHTVLEQLRQHVGISSKLMINASTLGLNGTERLKQNLPNADWVYLPDMVQEGNAIHSITQAKHLIVGCDELSAQIQIQELLRPLYPRAQQYIFMPVLDAEFTKLSISGMLATRISYINDLAVVAEKLGIDIELVRQGMASDSRIGSSYMFPGAGFGGENFTHDILTLANTVSNTGVKSQLLAQVWDINEQQKELLFRKLWNYFSGDLSGKTVAIWGAAFKENTFRTKQSPVHIMLAALWAQGVIVKLHDPQALTEIAHEYGPRDDLILCEDQYEACKDASALCLLTAWKQYWSLDYSTLMKEMEHPLILDGRNIYNPEYVRAQGFNYIGVGR